MKCFVRTCQIIIGPYSSHFPIQRGLQNAQSQTNDSNNTPSTSVAGPRWSRLYVNGSRCRSQTLFYQKFRGRLISGGIRASTPALAGQGPPMTKREKFKFLSLQPYISYIDQATYSLFVCALK